MDEDNIITLNDENGNEVEFEFLDLIPYRQNEYVVLLPIGDSDGQVVILQLKEIDDETEEYVGVENEFVLETTVCRKWQECLGYIVRPFTISLPMKILSLSRLAGISELPKRALKNGITIRPATS